MKRIADEIGANCMVRDEFPMSNDDVTILGDPNNIHKMFGESLADHEDDVTIVSFTFAPSPSSPSQRKKKRRESSRGRMVYTRVSPRLLEKESRSDSPEDELEARLRIIRRQGQDQLAAALARYMDRHTVRHLSIREQEDEGEALVERQVREESLSLSRESVEIWKRVEQNQDVYSLVRNTVLGFMKGEGAEDHVAADKDVVNKNVAQKEACGICLEEHDVGTERGHPEGYPLPCGHVVHIKCLVQGTMVAALCESSEGSHDGLKKALSCPVCRALAFDGDLKTLHVFLIEVADPFRSSDIEV